jgi:hypothetical protein
MSNSITRRQAVKPLAATAFAFQVVPRHVLGGPGYTPPSEKVTRMAITIILNDSRFLSLFLNEVIVHHLLIFGLFTAGYSYLLIILFTTFSEIMSLTTLRYLTARSTGKSLPPTK